MPAGRSTRPSPNGQMPAMRAEQRRFAGARLAADRGRFAGMQGEAAALQQQPPVGQRKVEVAQAQLGAGRDGALRAVPGQRAGGDDRAVEGCETFDRRRATTASAA